MYALAALVLFAGTQLSGCGTATTTAAPPPCSSKATFEACNDVFEPTLGDATKTAAEKCAAMQSFSDCLIGCCAMKADDITGDGNGALSGTVKESTAPMVTGINAGTADASLGFPDCSGTGLAITDPCA